MCEQFVARAAEPFRLDELWPFAERLERFGIAGFGWGATWLQGDGGLATHRSTAAFRDDPGRDDLAGLETTSALVHLRRPSRLSTRRLPDTQPFEDPGGRFAFSHNGELHQVADARRRYRAAGRIHGQADSEVGERWLEDRWTQGEPVGDLLASLHSAFGGVANLALVTRDGSVHHYAGNRENPVFAFRLGDIGIASTAIYSADRSVFQYAARGATARTLIRLNHTIALDQRGRPVESGPARRANP